ncbi:MAG: tetratricopeptide repeat protein [Gemmatimonadota bacterium]
MRRARRSRASGREQTVDELFGTSGLEADPVVRAPDQSFPLRPFASGIPHDERVNTEVETAESGPARLCRRAADAVTRGRRAEAIQLYREVLAGDASHLLARNNLALLLEESGDRELALEELNTAIRARPDEPALLVSRGAILGRLKRYPEAEADLRRVLKMQPMLAAARFTLGLVLRGKGLPAEAVAELRQATEIEPLNAVSHFYLGEALNQSGDTAGARAALERSVQLDSTQKKTFQLLGRLLDRIGQPDEAMAYYRRAREIRDE